MTVETKSDLGPFGHFLGGRNDLFLGQNTFFGHIFGFLCYFFAWMWPKGVKNEVLGKRQFWRFSSFFVGPKITIFNFCVIFCLNVVKMCEKSILREKSILPLLVSFWGPKNEPFWFKNTFFGNIFGFLRYFSLKFG